MARPIPRAIPSAGQSEHNLLQRADNAKSRRRALHDADVRHFGRVQSLVNARFLKACLEVFVVILFDLLGSLQLFDAWSKIGQSLRLFLIFAEAGFEGFCPGFNARQPPSFGFQSSPISSKATALR